MVATSASITSPASSICSRSSATSNSRAASRSADRTLWFNSFEQVHGETHPTVAAASAAALGGPPIQGLDEQTQAVVASVPQGNQLRKLATDLQVPFNEGAGAPLVIPLAAGRRTVPIADGLTFTILAPPKDQLDRLEHDWNKAKADHPADPAAQTADTWAGGSQHVEHQTVLT